MPKKEQDRRQREEEEATAHVFQEFIKTFQDIPATPKLFVHSGVLHTKTGEEIRSGKEQFYNPRPLLKRTGSSTLKNAIECARILKSNKLERPKKRSKPKTNLESLKEELKLKHTERETRIKVRGDLSVYSLEDTCSSDASSTNLFIGNIDSKLTEQDLMRIFGVYGPLASVKIMWPRNQESKSINCGFVAFMSRKDSERAMHELSDSMRIRWGKSVELPPFPVYVPPELLKSSLPPPYTGLPFNAQPLEQSFRQPKDEAELDELLYNSIVKVTVPVDRRLLMTIHRVIEFIVREGPYFEAMIMNREITNPVYSFLFDNKSSLHTYYRWKLYSILQGEGVKAWNGNEFRMFRNGSIWRPPVVVDYTKGMSEHSVIPSCADKSILSEAQCLRFVQLIQHLDCSNRKIAEAMVYCLTHSDAVVDVVDILVDSFMNESTEPPKKIARLYLLSDVLYNSSLKKSRALAYRDELEKHLSGIAQKLHTCFEKLTNETDKELFKTKVLSVLRSWELWKIYSGECLSNFENVFLLGSAPVAQPDDDSEPEDQNPPPQAASSSSGFVPSKWEAVDPQEVEAQAMSSKKFYTLEMERMLQEEEEEARSSKAMTQVSKKNLRKIEIKVMHYQDELESRNRFKRGQDLEREVNDYRDHLIKKLEMEPGKRAKDHEERKSKRRKRN